MTSSLEEPKIDVLFLFPDTWYLKRSSSKPTYQGTRNINRWYGLHQLPHGSLSDYDPFIVTAACRAEIDSEPDHEPLHWQQRNGQERSTRLSAPAYDGRNQHRRCQTADLTALMQRRLVPTSTRQLPHGIFTIEGADERPKSNPGRKIVRMYESCRKIPLSQHRGRYRPHRQSGKHQRCLIKNWKRGDKRT